MAENFDTMFYLPVSDTNSNPEASSPNLKPDDEPTLNDEAIIITEKIEYKPLNYHWFYTGYLADKPIWLPMSYKDSNNLEIFYLKNIKSIKDGRKNSRSSKNEFLFPIKGGRFEVDLIDLIKRPVYWNDTKLSEVRRCLWFYKENNEQRFLPYDEEYCEFLEIEYEKTLKSNNFHKRIDYVKISSPVPDKENKKNLPKQQSVIEEAFVFHSTSIMLHFTQANMLDEFSNLASDANRPRIVKRGIDEVVEKIEPDEIERIDHLCFVIHGIGEGCDLKFRPIVDCVDDFREIGAFIIDSHLKPHVESNGLNGRVEFLPISWHQDLHGDPTDPTGVDNRLKPISLQSIPKLRQYSNTTILDVLFYTSPIYCQTIISKVGHELNRLAKMFLERNPYFKGSISLIGHSLGSLIVFDILSHQMDNQTEEKSSESKAHLKPQTDISKCETINCLLERLNISEYKELFDKEKITLDSLVLLNDNDLSQMGLPLGPRKLLLEEIKNNLIKKDRLEVEKKIQISLQTLKAGNIASSSVSKKSADYYEYGLAGTGQLMIKYPRLNFKVANFFALGSPIPMFLTVRGIEKVDPDFKLPTCDNFFNIFHPFDPVAYRFEPLINSSVILKPVLMPHHKGRKRLHLELKEGLSKVGVDFYGQIKNAWSSLSKLPMLGTSSSTPSIEATTTTTAAIATTTLVSTETEPSQVNNEKQEKVTDPVEKVDFGKINKGRRIDYVLQEKPIESFNEYLFALASHACYWESEDTLLLIVKEIYGQGNTIDANTELQLSDQQQQSASWLTQTAVSAISTNVQKTFSYFNISVPQNISTVLASSLTSAIGSSSLNSNSNQNTANRQN